MTWLIRPEQPGDESAIAAVTEWAFREAPYSDHTEHHIVAALRKSGALVVSLVAEQAGQVVGHVAFSPVQISDGASDWYGLGPVSVIPPQQREGIGQALIREGLSRLRTRGAAGCVVLGEPEYYGRFGFIHRPECILKGVPPAYFQTLAFGTPEATGIVTYHAAFGGTTES